VGNQQIRTLGDPVLRERCRDVEVFDDALRALATEMTETMYAAPGVGLAANQVGLALRMFVYDAGDGEGPGAVANPEIVFEDGDQDEEEGCLSIPGVYRPTRRALRVRLQGVDLAGAPVSIEAEGLRARIFQHETDHLNGALYVDRLSESDRRSALAEYRDIELGATPSRATPTE
jgi:peptide deformylase